MFSFHIPRPILKCKILSCPVSQCRIFLWAPFLDLQLAQHLWMHSRPTVLSDTWLSLQTHPSCQIHLSVCRTEKGLGFAIHVRCILVCIFIFLAYLQQGSYHCSPHLETEDTFQGGGRRDEGRQMSRISLSSICPGFKAVRHWWECQSLAHVTLNTLPSLPEAQFFSRKGSKDTCFLGNYSVEPTLCFALCLNSGHVRCVTDEIICTHGWYERATWRCCVYVTMLV